MEISIHPENTRRGNETGLEYMRYEQDYLQPGDTVLDLGAYEGEFARKINDKYGCHVICVEPTSAITGLQRNDSFTVINKACATYNGKMRFGGQYYYTSAYQDGYSWRDFDCFDIATLFNREYGLVKINIEGYEYDLLRYLLEGDLISLCRVLQIQFHFISGRDSVSEYRAIYDKLLETHQLQWCCDFVWEQWKKR
jgi:FkbM family methyltransferase